MCRTPTPANLWDVLKGWTQVGRTACGGLWAVVALMGVLFGWVSGLRRYPERKGVEGPTRVVPNLPSTIQSTPANKGITQPRFLIVLLKVPFGVCYRPIYHVSFIYCFVDGGPGAWCHRLAVRRTLQTTHVQNIQGVKKTVDGYQANAAKRLM